MVVPVMWVQTEDDVCGDGSGQWPGWRCTNCGKVVCTRDNDQPTKCTCEPRTEPGNATFRPGYVYEQWLELKAALDKVDQRHADDLRF